MGTSSSQLHQSWCKAGEPSNRKPLGPGDPLDGFWLSPQHRLTLGSLDNLEVRGDIRRHGMSASGIAGNAEGK